MRVKWILTLAAVASTALACVLATSGGAASAGVPLHKQQTDTEQVLAFELKVAHDVETADIAALDKELSPDFSMTHGAQWTNGGTPTLVNNKTTFLALVANHAYPCFAFDNRQVEMHGDVAVVYGRYLGTVADQYNTQGHFFVVWYERIYQKHGHTWTYLSHRTVNGAHYGNTPAEALAGMGPADPALTCP